MKIKSLLLLGLLTMTGMNAFAADAFVNSKGVKYLYDDAVTGNGAKVYAVLGTTDPQALEIVPSITVGDLELKVVGFEDGWITKELNLATNDVDKTLTINIDNFTALPAADAFATINRLKTLTLKGTSTIDGNLTVPAYEVENLVFTDLAAMSGKNLTLADASGNTVTKTISVPAAMTGVKFTNNTSKLETVKGIKTIGDLAFADCPELKTVELADGATIGTSAFVKCAKLETINLGVAKTIGKGAFDDCAKLKNVVLTNAESIAGLAFRGTAVESLVIPGNIKKDGLVSGDEGSFAGMASLKEVTIQNNNLESVEKWFKDDAKLEKVTITSTSIKSLGTSAFEYTAVATLDLSGATALETIGNSSLASTKLTTFAVPATVKTIDEWAFANTALTSVDFTDAAALETIGANAFSKTALTSVKFDGATALETIGANAFKDIPATELDLSGATALKTVADNSFPQNAYTSVKLLGTALDNTSFPTAQAWLANATTSLEEITLPNGLTEIGGFAGFTALKAIGLPTKVETIKDNAFSNCTALTGIKIKKKVKTIGKSAFQGCTALATVNFSEATALTTIGADAFTGTALTTIDLSGATALAIITDTSFPTNKYTSVKLAGTALDDTSFPTAQAWLVNAKDGLTEITLPEGLTKIGGFTGFKALTSIGLPVGVTSIEKDAFKDCVALKGIKIKKNVKTIDESAFQGCTALTGLNLSEATALTEIKTKAFADCTALTAVDFAGATALTTIGVSAFNGDGLTTVTITGSIETIDDQAFFNNKLESVDFTEAAALTTIGANAFGVNKAEDSTITELDLDGATALTTVADNAFPKNAYTSVKTAGTQLAYTKEDGTYVDGFSSPFSSTNILANAGESLIDLTFPAGYQVNGFNKFEDFANLNSITLPADATEIPDNAFKDANITEFVVSDKITRIGKNAFNGSALESIDFTNATALETIDKYAFANTANLEAVGLPKNLEVISENVFEGSAIKGIKIKNKVKSIEGAAFRNAANLTQVNFEDARSLEEIKAEAFKGTPLTVIDLDGATALTTVAADAFDANNKYTNVLLGGTALDDVAFSVPFATILTNSKSSLEEITLPQGLTEIADDQFKGFEKLTAIGLPKGVTRIGERAFMNSGLKGIKIKQNVETIDEDAFKECTALSAVNMSEATALKYINDGAFLGCYAEDAEGNVISGLTSVAIPGNVVSIGAGAFTGCAALATVDFSEAAALEEIGMIAFNKFGSTYPATAITSVDLSACAKLKTIAGDAFPANEYTSVKLGGTILTDESFKHFDFSAATATLAELTLPATITEIPDNWFGETRFADAEGNKPFSALTAVVLPEGVKSVGKTAFQGAGLTELTVGKNVETILQSAFENCENLATVDFSEATALSGISASAFQNTAIAEVAIPANADNKKHLAIAKKAFADCANLTSFTAESWAGALADALFQNCVSLPSIDVPAAITSIGSYAFDGCEALTTVNFLHAKRAEILSSIGDYAFKNCAALTALDLSKTKLVNLDSDYPFEGCTALAEITFPEELRTINSDGIFADTPIENFEAPYLTESAQLFGYYREFDEEDGSFLGYEWRDKDHANTTLKTVKMGGPIESGCFAFCTALESVEWLGGKLGSSISPFFPGMDPGDAFSSSTFGAVAPGAFAYCTALKTFTYVPEEPVSELKVSDDAFVGCTPYVMFVTNSNYMDWLAANHKGAAPVNATFGDNVDVTTVKTVQDKANAKQFVGKYVNNTNSPVYVDANEAKLYSIYVDGDAAYFQACRTFNGYYIIQPQVRYEEGVDGSISTVGDPGFESHVIFKTDEAKEIQIKRLTMTDAIKFDLVRFLSRSDASSIAYDDVYDSQKDDDLTRVQYGAREASATAGSAGWYLYRLTNTAGQGFGFTAFTGSTVKEGQFFVVCEKKPAGAGRLAEVWLDEDGKVISGDVTGIESVEKIDVNNGAIYNLQGVRVDNPVKGGLYIQNGKKIVVK